MATGLAHPGTPATVPSPAAPAPGGLPAGWRGPLLALLAGVLALGWLFRAEALAAVRTWDSSAAYNHGWLVLPIALWLAWGRRGRLPGLRPRPQPWIALLALPVAAVWLLAERLGIMEGRQFAALGLFYVLVPAVLGWRIGLAMAAPLAYLVFLVPFGAFAVPWLQTITARMIDFGLNFTGIPHFVDELIIEVPAATFYVAEACAGLRFAIASLAFGGLYALVMFRSPWRRLAVMLLAIAVPVLANGLRTLGLVVWGQMQGSAAAIAADHVLYGWLFFSIVLLLLIAAGLPFRQDHRPVAIAPAPFPAPAPLAASPRRGWQAGVAALLAVLCAGAAPAAVRLLDRGSDTPPREMAVPLQPAPGCAAQPDGTLQCGTVRATARLLIFAPRTNWSMVAAARRRAVSSGSDEDVTFDVQVAGGTAGTGANWRARQPQGHEPGLANALAAAAWLDGRPAGDGLRSRATQAYNALRGGKAGGPVVAMVELRSDTPADSTRDRLLLRGILEAQAAHLALLAAETSAGRGG